MKSFKLGVFAAFSMLVHGSARAEMIKLVTLTAEAEKNSVAYIGINTDTENKIESFFHLGSDKKMRTYTLPQLKTRQVLLNKKGYDVVYVKSDYSTETSVHLKLFMKKDARDGFESENISTRSFAIEFNANTNEYQIVDESARPFKVGHVTSHYHWLGPQTGIEALYTR